LPPLDLEATNTRLKNYQKLSPGGFVSTVLLPIKISMPVVVFTLQIASAIVMVSVNFVKGVAMIAGPLAGYGFLARILVMLAIGV
jgi:hypothetical protein